MFRYKIGKYLQVLLISQGWAALRPKIPEFTVFDTAYAANACMSMDVHGIHLLHAIHVCICALNRHVRNVRVHV